MKEKAGALARDFAPEAATLAVLVAVFWFFMKTGMLNDRELVQPLLWHLMILICIGTLILAFCKKLTYERLISVIDVYKRQIRSSTTRISAAGWNSR